MRVPTMIAAAFALVATSVATTSLAQAAEAVLGKWLTKGGRSHVVISRCGNTICGKIVWLKEPNDKAGKPKTDIRNKNEALRSRPLMGLSIIKGFTKADDKGAYWTGGTIYNAADGKTYKCYIQLQSDGRLKVRGYVAISGASSCTRRCWCGCRGCRRRWRTR